MPSNHPTGLTELPEDKLRVSPNMSYSDLPKAKGKPEMN